MFKSTLLKAIFPLLTFASWQDSLFSKDFFIEDNFLDCSVLLEIQLTIRGVNKSYLSRQIIQADVSQLFVFPTYRTIF